MKKSAKPAQKPPARKADPAAQAAFKKGLAMSEQGRHAEALPFYKEALRHDMGHQYAWANLATTLRKLGLFEASAACCKRALELAPDNPGYLMNYGNCLVDLCRIDEALEVFKKANRLQPNDYKLLTNYAVARREAGHIKETPALFHKLRQMKPDDPSPEWEETLAHLMLGDYLKGWETYDIRWKLLPKPPAANAALAPRWQGEDIKGKTLLVHEEQGFGDSIICSRFIPLVAARGGKVILECKKPLHRLFSTIPGIVKMAEAGETKSGFDYHIPMMSLPGVIKTTIDTIPAPPPLMAAPAMPPLAAQLLKQGEGFLKVGVIWSGSVTFSYNHKRAVTAQRFLPFAEIPGLRLYSLQKGPREDDMRALGGESLCPSLGPLMSDFAETAAVLKQLDLIIMTDSSVAHVAGSLGVPVWNLLTFHPYWLYGMTGPRCPWYSSMRLFRQPKPGDWDSVFIEVMSEVKKLVENRRAAKA